jgi:preprotein translocase subunit YajC
MLPYVFDAVMLAAESSPGGEAAPGQGRLLTHMIIPLVLIFGVMYFILVLPQKRRERQRKEMLDAIRKGDEIVTIGGIHGEVVRAGEKKIVVDVGGGHAMTFSRAAIARVVRDDEEAEKS